MDQQEAQRNAVENYVKAYNRFDVEGMLKDLHAEVEFRNITQGTTTMLIKGIGNFKKQAFEAVKLFREREQTILHIRQEESRIEIDIDYRGILAADLPNGMRAGDSLVLSGSSVFLFSGHTIISIQDFS